jgi:hypothetical protein
MKLKCPFDDGTTVELFDGANPTGLSERIREFQATLSLEQRPQFRIIEDMMVDHVNQTQKNTIKKLYCPRCKIKGVDCE